MPNDIKKTIKANMKLGINANIKNAPKIQKEFDKLANITIHPKIDQKELNKTLAMSIAKSTRLSLKIQDVSIDRGSFQSAINKASTNVKLNIVKFNFDQVGIQTALNAVAQKAKFTMNNLKLDLNSSSVSKLKNKIEATNYKIKISPDKSYSKDIDKAIKDWKNLKGKDTVGVTPISSILKDKDIGGDLKIKDPESIAKQMKKERARIKSVVIGIKEEYNNLIKDLASKKDKLRKASPTLDVEQLNSDIEKLEQAKNQMDNVFRKGFVFSSTFKMGGQAFQKLTVQVDKNGKEIASTVKNIGQSIGTLSGGSKNMMKRIAGYGTGAMIFYSLIRGVKLAIQSLDGFETKMAQMKMIMDPAKTDFDQLGKSAFGMAKKYGIAIEEVMSAMVVFAQQGREQSDVISLVETSLLAANVTTMSAKEATDFLTAAVLQFNKSADESIDFLDKWVNVASKNAVTARVLAEATKGVGVAARLAGLDINYFNGMVTAISAATRKTGKEVGTGLRYIFRQFRRDKAIKALQDSGIAIFSSGNKFARGSSSKGVGTEYRSLQKIIEELAGKWKDLTQVQRENIASALGGRRHYNVIKVLFENYDQALKATTDSENSWGSALSKNQIIMKTFGKTIEKIKVLFQEMVVSLGSGGAASFLDVFKIGAEGLGVVLSLVTKILSPFKELVAVVGSLGLAFLGIQATVSRLGFQGMSIKGLTSKVKEYSVTEPSPMMGHKAYNKAVSGPSVFAFGPQNKEISKQQDLLNKAKKGSLQYRNELKNLNKMVLNEKGITQGVGKMKMGMSRLRAGVKGTLKAFGKFGSFLMGPFGIALMVGIPLIKGLVESFNKLENSAEEYLISSKKEVDAINFRIGAHNKLILILKEEQRLRDKSKKSGESLSVDNSKNQLSLMDKITSQYPGLIAGHTKYGKAILDANYLLKDGSINIEKIVANSNKLSLDTKLEKVRIELKYISKLFKDIGTGQGFLDMGNSALESFKIYNNAIKSKKISRGVLGNEKLGTVDLGTTKLSEEDIELFKKESKKYGAHLRKAISLANKTVANIVSQVGSGQAISMMMNKKVKKGGSKTYFEKFYEIELMEAKRLYARQAGGDQKSIQSAYVNMYSRFMPNREMLTAFIKDDQKELQSLLTMESLKGWTSIFKNIVKTSNLGELKNVGRDISINLGKALESGNIANFGKIFDKAFKDSGSTMNKDVAFNKMFGAIWKNRFFTLKERGKDGKYRLNKFFMNENRQIEAIAAKTGKRTPTTITRDRLDKSMGMSAISMKGDKPDGRFMVQMVQRSKLMEGMVNLLDSQINLIDRYNNLLKENLNIWKGIYSVGEQTSDSTEALADIKVGTSGGLMNKIAVAAPMARQFSRDDLSFGEMQIDVSKNEIGLGFLSEISNQYKVMATEAKLADDANVDFFDNSSKGYKSMAKDLTTFSQISGLKLNIDDILPTKASVKKRAEETFKEFKDSGAMKAIQNMQIASSKVFTTMGGKGFAPTPEKEFKRNNDRLVREEAITKAAEKRSQIEQKALGKMVTSYSIYIDKLKEAEGLINNKLARTNDPMAIQLLTAQSLVYQLKRQRLELMKNETVQKGIVGYFKGISNNLFDVATRMSAGLKGNVVSVKQLAREFGLTKDKLRGWFKGGFIDPKNFREVGKALALIQQRLKQYRKESNQSKITGKKSETSKEVEKLKASELSASGILGKVREKMRKMVEEAKKLRVEALSSFVKAFSLEARDIAMMSDAGLRVIGTRFENMRKKIFDGIKAVYGSNTSEARVARKRFLEALAQPLPFSSSNIDKLYAKMASPARYKKYFNATINVAEEQAKLLGSVVKSALDLGFKDVFDKPFSVAFKSKGFGSDIISPQAMESLKLFGNSFKEIQDTFNRLNLASHFEKMNMEISKLNAQMSVFGQSWQHLDKTVSIFRSTLDGIINKSVEQAGNWDKVDSVTKQHIMSLKNELTQLEEIKAKNDLIKSSFEAVGKAIGDNIFKGESFAKSLGQALMKVRQDIWSKQLTGLFTDLAGILSDDGSASTKKFETEHAHAIKLQKLVDKAKKKALIDMNIVAAEKYVNTVMAGFKKISNTTAKDNKLVGSFKKVASDGFGPNSETQFKKSVVGPLNEKLKKGEINEKQFIKELIRIRELLKAKYKASSISESKAKGYISKEARVAVDTRTNTKAVVDFATSLSKNTLRNAGSANGARDNITTSLKQVYSTLKKSYGVGVAKTRTKKLEDALRSNDKSKGFMEKYFPKSGPKIDYTTPATKIEKAKLNKVLIDQKVEEVNGKKPKKKDEELTKLEKGLQKAAEIVGMIAVAKGSQALTKGLFGGSSAVLGNEAIKNNLAIHATTAGSESGMFGKEVGAAAGKGIGTALGGPIGGAIGEAVLGPVGQFFGSLFADSELIDLQNAHKDAKLNLLSVETEQAGIMQQLNSDLEAFRLIIQPITNAFKEILGGSSAGLNPDGTTTTIFSPFSELISSGMEGFADRLYNASIGFHDLISNTENISDVFGILSDAMTDFVVFLNTSGGTGITPNIKGIIDSSTDEINAITSEIESKKAKKEAQDEVAKTAKALMEKQKLNYEVTQRRHGDKDQGGDWGWTTEEDVREAQTAYLASLKDYNDATQASADTQAEINALVQKYGDKLTELTTTINGVAEIINGLRDTVSGTASAWKSVVEALEYNLGTEISEIFNNIFDNLGNITLDFIDGFDNSLLRTDITGEDIAAAILSGDYNLMQTTGDQLNTAGGDPYALMWDQIYKISQADETGEVAKIVGEQGVAGLLKALDEYKYSLIKDVSEGFKWAIAGAIDQDILGFHSLAFTAKDYYDILSKTADAITSELKLMVDNIKIAVDEFRMTASAFREQDFMTQFESGRNVIDIYRDLSENGTRAIRLFEQNALGQLNVTQEAKDFYQDQANLIGGQVQYSEAERDRYGEELQKKFASTGDSATLQASFAGGARTLTADELYKVVNELRELNDDDVQLKLFNEFYNTYLDASQTANDKAQELIEMSKEANELLYKIQKAYQDEYSKPSKDRLVAEANLRALQNLEHSIDRATGNVFYTAEGEVNKISEAEMRAIKEIDPNAQIAITLENFDKLYGSIIQNNAPSIESLGTIRPITQNFVINLDIESLDASQMDLKWQRDLALVIKKEFETIARNYSGK